MLRRRTLIQGLLATVATPALAQNSFLTPGGSSVPGIVTMCLSSNVAVPCATGGGGSFPPNVSGTQATIAADFAGQQYWASAASQASFAAWMTAIGGTYARASSATYLQGGVVKTATANTPRFPTSLGGIAQGIRLTGAATNIHLQSSISSSIASYQDSGTGDVTTANATTDPSGGAAAASFIPSASNAWHFLRLGAGVNITTGTIYTQSAYVKPFGPTVFQASIDPDATGTAPGVFTLVGAGNASNPGLGTATIQQLANGWYRITQTFTATTTGGVFAPVGPWIAGSRVLMGDGVSGLYIWGMQYEANPFPTDYIPTTTATVTQAADSFTFPFTQTTFSALVGSGGFPFDGTGQQRLLTGFSNQFPIYAPDATHFARFDGTSGILNSPAITDVSNPHKVMVAGGPALTQITADGLVPTTVAGNISIPAFTNMVFATSSGGSVYGNFPQLAIWNGLVASTAEMQRLST